MARDIKITIKFYSGIGKELNLQSYDPSKGIEIDTTTGTRLKKILKGFGLTNISSYAYFSNGERIGLWSKFNDGDQVSCLKPSAGG